MKSPAFLIVALVVALLVLFGAVKALITPIAKHYYAQYQHHRMIEERRNRFYAELGMLMRHA
jgi:O-antigen ligase